MQAYCYRVCLTDHPDNRIPFPKPEGYDPAQYELLLRIYATGWRETFEKFDPVPNRKTDTNNHGPFSTDNIGMNYDYPEASYERRREILQEHETYQKGWLYFIANDPRVPKDVQERMRQWGLAKDEFADNGGWPHQIYVREARRMVGEFVMTENELLKRRPTPESVGMGSYTIDSHNVQRYITPEGYVQNEGDIGVPPNGPLRDRLRRARARNAARATTSRAGLRLQLAHRLRLDPHGAGVHDPRPVRRHRRRDRHRRGVAVQDVPYPKLRAQLLKDGQVLEVRATEVSREPPTDVSSTASECPSLPALAWARMKCSSAIGAGGMGEVYKARDTKLHRDVAIKVLPDLFTADPDRLARFEREAQVLASLNHPNIAQVYGLEDSSRVRALVMELVEGQTLSELLAAERGRGLPFATAWPLAAQIAAGLAAAHERGIVHRDLKPANVIVRGDGHREGARFRSGQGLRAGDGGRDELADRRRCHRGRARPWHRCLYVARAGSWTARRRALRHLGVRRGPLRDADGAVVLRKRDGVGHRCRRPDEGARLDESAGASPASLAPLPREGSEAPALQHRRRAVHRR